MQEVHVKGVQHTEFANAYDAEKDSLASQPALVDDFPLSWHQCRVDLKSQQASTAKQFWQILGVDKEEYYEDDDTIVDVDDDEGHQ